ncbi:MAG TPA: hypothetical protein VNZ45_02605, partial [Bacteroidia bacterium]|nr:hypothetical protein [Bacteroidia bacterium]
LSISQGDILTNFASLSTYLNVNHVDFGINNDFGKHKQLSMPVQTAFTVAAPNEVVLVCKKNMPTGNNEIYFQRSSDGVQTPITAYKTGTYSDTVPYTYLYTFFPSGVLVVMGTIPVGSASQNMTVNYPTGVGAQFVGAPFVQFTTITSNIPAGSANNALFQLSTESGASTALKFKVTTNAPTASTVGFNFLAIGIGQVA